MLSQTRIRTEVRSCRWPGFIACFSSEQAEPLTGSCSWEEGGGLEGKNCQGRKGASDDMTLEQGLVVELRLRLGPRLGCVLEGEAGMWDWCVGTRRTSPGPPQSSTQRGPSRHSRCRAPPGTREAPLGSRLGCVFVCVCVCACACVCGVCVCFLFLLWSIRFFSETCFFFSFFLIFKNKMQMNKTPNCQSEWNYSRIWYERNEIFVSVCVVLTKRMNPWLSCYLQGCLRPRFLPRVVLASSIACFVRWVCVSRPTRWSTINWKTKVFRHTLIFHCSLVLYNSQSQRVLSGKSYTFCLSFLHRRMKVEWMLLSSPIRHIPTNPDQ